MRKFFVYTLAVLSVFIAFGQNPSDSVNVYFRLNQGRFEPSLNGNAASMNAFIEKINEAVRTNNLDHIVVCGYTSPDGPTAFNERLAKTRCETIATYIAERTGIGRDVIRTKPEGVAWNELRHLVADSKSVPSRAQILEIIDDSSIPGNSRGGDFERNKQLKSLAGGVPYRWMLCNIFPRLRHVFAISVRLKSDDTPSALTAVVETAEPVPEINAADTLCVKNGTDATGSVAGIAPNGSEHATSEISSGAEISNANPLSTQLAGAESANTNNIRSSGAELSNTNPSGTLLANAESSAQPMTVPAIAEIPTHHRFALKTNMLYYAALMPNLELEWLCHDKWSVSVEGNVAWWGDDPKNKSYRLAVIDAEVRRWIKPRAPWHGMFVGAFVAGGWYDLENGGLGYYGEGGMAGLSFGYMWPVGKNFSLSAEVGAGYMYTRFKEYEPFEGHYLYERTKSLNYFGPLMLKFSIAWRFSDRNKSKRIKSDYEK